jgi:predicted MFS family arabinose efflux permease
VAAGSSPPAAVPDDALDGTGPRSAHRRRGLLWHRNFRLLWIGESISGMGTAMAAVGIPLLATAALHASTFAVATLTAASYLPWLVIGLPAGAWVDRLPSRTLMIICDLISALLCASLPVAGWFHVLGIRLLIAAALLAGCANVFFITAYRVYLPSLVKPDDLVEANAKLQGSTSVANICGRGAAGITAQAVGYAPALLVNAVSFLVSLGCLLSIRGAEPRRAPAARTTTIRAEIASGISFIAHDPYLRPLTLYGAGANLAYSGSTALVVVFLVRVVGLSSATAGLLLAVSGIGGILGALIARRLARWLGTARALLAAPVGTSVFALLIPLTSAGVRVAYFAIGSTVVATGIVTANIIIGSFQQAHCPPGILGRVSASMRFLVFGGIPLGALLAGGLATALGTRNALWIILALYVLSGSLLLTPAVLSQRNLGGSTRR